MEQKKGTKNKSKENEAIQHYIEVPTILKPRIETPPSIEQFVKRKLQGNLNDNKISDAISDKVSDKFMTLHQRSKTKNRPLKKKTSKRLTSKKRKELKLFELSEECEKYDLYLPLHNLWKGYIENLTQGQGDISSMLIKADYHGAYIKVIQSKSPDLIGIEGIVLQETMRTFKLITKENKYKVIPKTNSNFSFVVGSNLVIIYGNQIACRVSERSIKKFKKRESIDL